MYRYHDNDHAAWEAQNGPAVFVFGSNTAGRHGAGAARYAARVLKFPMGVGEGLRGRAYALPTVLAVGGIALVPLAPEAVFPYARRFIECAGYRRDLVFFVSAVGTGLAGHSHRAMASLFRGAPDTCVMPPEWREYLEP